MKENCDELTRKKIKNRVTKNKTIKTYCLFIKYENQEGTGKHSQNIKDFKYFLLHKFKTSSNCEVKQIQLDRYASWMDSCSRLYRYFIKIYLD